ncbi:MAG: hypothetical protein V7704_18325 [Aurantimonas endophytica]|uniref:DUF551 domain-containing protein n=1 Tax=Aurantimonas endophytica TaxID=1522175 RepID=A0A7W6HAP9_9HYPH|nr:hypothetical protein [Aurantimonas endophytica]MBB4001719.1 hypothetical protein [Aurantimonas endophytica]MCO6402644.1 hypothetical protein [Aurantimonas endophytica]
MVEHEPGPWQPMSSVQRDGARILVTVRAGEQGPAEVDTVRWTSVRGAPEKAWVATDTDADSPVAYQDDELLAWMPFPEPPAGRGTAAAPLWPDPALESDFEEEQGSGI